MKPTLCSVKRSSILVCVVLLAAALLCAGSAGAQYSKTWYGHIAGAYSTVQGDAGDAVDDGISLMGGTTWRPEGRRVGFTAELGFHDFDIDQAVAEALDARDGTLDIVSFTIGPSWIFQKEGQAGFQFSVAAGLYDVTGELTEPGLFLGPVCDPWFWWCYPGIVPGDVIVARESTTQFGFNIGLGVTFDVGIDKQIFLEARFHRINTQSATEFIPITVGFRW